MDVIHLIKRIKLLICQYSQIFSHTPFLCISINSALFFQKYLYQSFKELTIRGLFTQQVNVSYEGV